MSKQSEFEDRFAIRELIDLWSAAVNEQDWETLGTCFVEDGTWDVGPPYNMLFKGNKEIMNNVPPLIKAQQYVIQTPHAIAITLNGDSATARVTMEELMRGHDGTGMHMWGTYYDDLVRTADGWKFKLRRFRVTIFNPVPVPGEMYRTYGNNA